MPLTTIPLPYGLRDVKIYTYTGDTPAATGVDLPNAQTFSFSEAEEFTELRGDDGLVAVHGKGPAVDWTLDAGGISLEALKAINGGTITESGVSPAQVKTYAKTGTDSRPYFKVEGQAISDSGGDFHVVIYKCRATGEVTGQLQDGVFWTTGCKGRALPDTSGKLYDFVQNETAVALT